MDIAAIKHTTTLTGDDLTGLRRKKPANTFVGPVQDKPVNTSTAHLKPAIRTHVTQKDMDTPGLKDSTLSTHDRLVKQTQSWVAQTFFGTLLKQVRESPFKSDLFDGGRGGQAFGSMYDQQLAERMSRGAGAHLVNSIVHRIEARSAAVRQQVSSSLQSNSDTERKAA